MAAILIKNQQNFIWLDFERETFPEHLGPGYGVVFSAVVSCLGFRGEIENIFIPRGELIRFLSDLRILEERRNEKAILKTFQAEFYLEFYAIDQLGHVAVRIDLVNHQYSRLCQLKVSACFDVTEYLISIVDEFKELLDE